MFDNFNTHSCRSPSPAYVCTTVLDWRLVSLAVLSVAAVRMRALLSGLNFMSRITALEEGWMQTNSLERKSLMLSWARGGETRERERERNILFKRGKQPSLDDMGRIAHTKGFCLVEETGQPPSKHSKHKMANVYSITKKKFFFLKFSITLLLIASLSLH